MEMGDKPPEEGYISVVDEEPEILELLKWDNSQIQKQQDPQPQPPQKMPEKSVPKAQECDPFDLNDPNFIEAYRLSKDIARNLCEELKPLMADSTKYPEVPAEIKILATLSFFATGKPQKSNTKTDSNFMHYLATTAIIQVIEAINHPTIVKKYIHFPHMREERDVIKARFYMKYGMPNVLGCIDCTHVPLLRPDDNQKSHFNKSYHSKKVQIICDSDLTIMSVDPSPGSHSHSAVFTRHAVRVDLDSLNHSGTEQCWLIGSPYFHQKPYMMTPIPKIPKKSPVSPEKHYNTLHAQTHSAVIDTIKHLKSRWKCLQATCNRQFDSATVSMMIVACCVLHNLCNRRGLPICPMTPAEERLEAMKQKVANGPVPKKMNDDKNGTQVRAQLVERLWNERRVAPEEGKKRSKKDRLLETQHQAHQSQVQHNHDDPSKRPRLAMSAPTSYAVGIVPPGWSCHYPPHQHL